MQIEELVKNNNVLNVYTYGSRVYGTNDKNSDYDYIVVLENKILQDYYNLTLENADCTFYNQTEFEILLKEQEISVLEAIYIGEKLKETIIFDHVIDLEKLRISISTKSSNSYVKAKKKILQNDYFLGIKSLFHSIRILDYGIQLATSSKIENIQKHNYIYFELVDIISNKKDLSNEELWFKIDSKYKKIYNLLSSQFKLVAPKTDKINKKQLIINILKNYNIENNDLVNDLMNI